MGMVATSVTTLVRYVKESLKHLGGVWWASKTKTIKLTTICTNILMQQVWFTYPFRERLARISR
jgi:hypothetical protein